MALYQISVKNNHYPEKESLRKTIDLPEAVQIIEKGTTTF
jgi:hypothetical protein